MYPKDPASNEEVNRDRVYISWTDFWPLEKYVLYYLRSRRLATDDDARATVLRQIAKYPGHAVYRKLEMDFYLDSSLLTKTRYRTR